MQFQDVVLRPSKKKWISVLAISIVFMVATIAMLIQGENIAIALLGLALFGAGVPLSILQLVSSKSYLYITAQGLTVSSVIGKPWALQWNDIDEFVTYKPRGGTMVGFHYSNTYQGQQVGRAIASQIAHVEGGLPDTYGMSAEALVNLLNSYLMHYRTPATPAVTQPPAPAQNAGTPLAV